jgi:hypothetical protein
MTGLREVIIKRMLQSKEYEQLVMRIRDIKLNKPMKVQIKALKSYVEESVKSSEAI